MNTVPICSDALTIPWLLWPPNDPTNTMLILDWTLLNSIANKAPNHGECHRGHPNILLHLVDGIEVECEGCSSEQRVFFYIIILSYSLIIISCTFIHIFINIYRIFLCLYKFLYNLMLLCKYSFILICLGFSLSPSRVHGVCIVEQLVPKHPHVHTWRWCIEIKCRTSSSSFVPSFFFV